jgi:hypothetical protein
MVERESRALKPLGVFGPRPGQSLDLSRDQLSELRGFLDDDVRQRVANYLSGGAPIFALMEYTTDILEGAFGVSGGSAIMSDGAYYWRRDAADYVRHYGIDVGAEARSHMSSNHWVPPKLSQEEILEIDRYLYELLRGSA